MPISFVDQRKKGGNCLTPQCREEKIRSRRGEKRTPERRKGNFRQGYNVTEKESGRERREGEKGR